MFTAQKSRSLSLTHWLCGQSNQQPARSVPSGLQAAAALDLFLAERRQPAKRHAHRVKFNQCVQLGGHLTMLFVVASAAAADDDAAPAPAAAAAFSCSLQRLLSAATFVYNCGPVCVKCILICINMCVCVCVPHLVATQPCHIIKS